MSHILNDKCSCGGLIVVVSYEEKASIDNNYQPEMLVSHGTCIECLQDIVLPPEEYFYFTEKFCYWRERI